MNRWDRRIERAKVLEREYPAAAELMRFYAAIARFQKQVEGRLPAVSAATPMFSLDPASIPESVQRFVDPLLELLQQSAPPELAQTAMLLSHLDRWDPMDPAVRFITRVLVQPWAEHLARGTVLSEAVATSTCPFCGESPVAAVLRPEGDGGKRSLLCGLCATEWGFRRMLCPRCGEEDQLKLPVYTNEPFPHVRIEACDTCRGYVKAIDLTRNGLSVPDVDELASVPLDLWAAENDYVKLRGNLFGL